MHHRQMGLLSFQNSSACLQTHRNATVRCHFLSHRITVVRSCLFRLQLARRPQRSGNYRGTLLKPHKRLSARLWSRGLHPGHTATRHKSQVPGRGGIRGSSLSHTSSHVRPSRLQPPPSEARTLPSGDPSSDTVEATERHLQQPSVAFTQWVSITPRASQPSENEAGGGSAEPGGGVIRPERLTGASF